MTTVARAPRGREIAAFATLYTAGALSSGLVPCLASSESPPQPSGPPPRRDEDRDHEHPSDDEPPMPPAAAAESAPSCELERGDVVQIAPGVCRDGQPLQAWFGVVEAVHADAAAEVLLEGFGEVYSLSPHEYRRVGRAAWRWRPEEERCHELEEVADATDASDELLAVARVARDQARIASGAEPDTEAWRAFLETAEGAAISVTERAALAAMLWPNGQPTVESYSELLAVMRAPRERDVDERDDRVSSLGAVYLARISDVETDGELSPEYFARKATHGTAYGATLAAHLELAGVDLPTAALALARGLRRACGRRWLAAGAREHGPLLAGLRAIVEGDAANARREAIADGLAVDSELDAVLGTLASAALGKELWPVTPWYLAFSTFEVLSTALDDDEEILRVTMLRTIEALALDRMWGPR